MDWQYQQGHGPADPSSPFHKFAMANDKKRKRTDPKSIFSQSLTPTEGSHTAFSSPGKDRFPSLREPNGQPYFFNTQSTNAPTSPYRNPSFTTPRKDFDIDFSSGPESSPRPQAEEETPDGKPLPAIPLDLKPKSSKRNSLFNFYGKWAPSSGKGDVKKPASDAIAKRIYKKRRQGDLQKQLIRARMESEASSEGEEEEVRTTKRSRKQNKALPPPPQEVGWMTGLFTFIHTYPDAPSIMAKYLQVFFNAAILAGCLFMFWSFYATIRSDVDKASEDALQEILAEITACTKHFIDNGCGSANRMPALQGPCSNWELCMNRDPNSVKRARLSAHTFAEIFNSFVEPISLKTMLFTTLVVGLALLINNATFTLYRRSQEHHGDGYRSGSAQYGMHPGPHNAHMGQLAMTPGFPYQTPQHWNGLGMQGQIGYDQSPSKDRGRSRSPEKKRLMLEN